MRLRTINGPIVENRIIGNYDITSKTDEKRIFVPDPRRPDKKIPVYLTNHYVYFKHLKTNDTVIFGGYKHHGQWLYSHTNINGDKKTGLNLNEISNIITRMIPVDKDGVERLMKPHATEYDISVKAPTSQDDALRAINALLNMKDELEQELLTSDDLDKAELEKELENIKSKLVKYNISSEA